MKTEGLDWSAFREHVALVYEIWEEIVDVRLFPHPPCRDAGRALRLQCVLLFFTFTVWRNWGRTSACVLCTKPRHVLSEMTRRAPGWCSETWRMGWVQDDAHTLGVRSIVGRRHSFIIPLNTIVNGIEWWKVKNVYFQRVSAIIDTVDKTYLCWAHTYLCFSSLISHLSIFGSVLSLLFHFDPNGKSLGTHVGHFDKCD